MNILRKIKTNHILAITIGIVYVWFGSLKFFSFLSPAEILAKKTIKFLTLGMIPSDLAIILLASLEVAIGILLLFNLYRKKVAIVALGHLILTFVPLFLFTEDSFMMLPFSFSLLGQYIFKNIVIMGALVTLYRLPTNCKPTIELEKTQKIS
ncbi:doxx family protein [Polaribacter sp. HL-MS24]|uniref:doxx family protein n=1 Tax=Polaribacter sp. HL-MS24 TaxID=3077735 RepID=UPI002934CD5D|nr:doxx family protein [Polaribacter sp. HL-MS24]WOC40560.1 doxx family protein [Polaribacter sp. HL-MS24]